MFLLSPASPCRLLEGATIRPTHASFSLKKNDAEPLTREDIQYDLLHCIFNDSQECWNDQSYLYTISGAPPKKVTFRELYINAIFHSSKLSGTLRERMQVNESFASEFAKIALLVNIGRINTTMACAYHTWTTAMMSNLRLSLSGYEDSAPNLPPYPLSSEVGW